MSATGCGITIPVAGAVLHGNLVVANDASVAQLAAEWFIQHLADASDPRIASTSS